MNYQKIYDDIIYKRRQIEILSKKKFQCETHHIKPRSLNGTNTIDNLVNLTLREHYFCHKLLVKITLQKYGKHSKEYFKMIYALRRMSNYKKYKNFRSSRTYEIIKKDFIQCISYNASIANKGRKLSNERKLQNKIDSSRRRWMFNRALNESHFVKPEEFEMYKNNGYVFGRLLDQSGDKNPIHHHTFSKTECKNRSKRRALLNKINPPCKGKIWINNGKIQKYIDKDSDIPAGFIKGRLKKLSTLQ